MLIDFLVKVFEEHRERDFIVWQDTTVTYGWLLEKLVSWSRALEENNVVPGTVVMLQGDYSPNSIALLLALIQRSRNRSARNT